jgi:SHS2 domain-containing protein
MSPRAAQCRAAQGDANGHVSGMGRSRWRRGAPLAPLAERPARALGRGGTTARGDNPCGQRRANMSSASARPHPPVKTDVLATPRSHWEHVQAGADLGVRGIAGTKAGAYEQAALALSAVAADPAAIQQNERVEIECEGADDESLLVAWLDAVIAEMAARQMVFAHFHVELHPRRLVGSAAGERVLVDHAHTRRAVTRATFKSVRVARLASGEWVAQAVVR